MSDHRASEPGFSRNNNTLDENDANGEMIVTRPLNKYGSFEIPQSETSLREDLQMLKEPASANNMNVKHSQQSAISQFNNQSRGMVIDMQGNVIALLQTHAARARLSRCTANHYVLLKCNAESLEYEHLETRRLKFSILPHPPQSGMVNLGNSVEELEAQRKCTQHLLGKLFYAPATDRSVEKIEHLNLILSTIKRKQQWLKSNQYTALNPKQV
ncbi:unnamed protein product [Lampetra fluviatilis]